MAMNAFYQTAITFSGQNYGAGKLKRVDKVCGLSDYMADYINFCILVIRRKEKRRLGAFMAVRDSMGN